MASLVKELIEAGIHFGQRRSNWNPKMRPYIFATRNQIHIIDIKETIKGLLLARKLVQKVTSEGRDVVFVGTKRQAQNAIETHCAESNQPYVTERWLGGTLTNFRTIRERLKRLEQLDQLIDSGEIKSYSKKMESQLLREQRKIHRNLNGIRNMSKLPGAMVVVDVNREKNALNEARNLGIPTICLIDTDGDPNLADIPIPGNDDSMRSIDVVVRELCNAAGEGREKAALAAAAEREGDSDGDNPAPRRRSSRSQFRASDPATEAPAAEAPAEAETPAPADTGVSTEASGT
ncbi:MAG: 30S ribosomal protein S2 [Phycisphaerae bacterium]|nr:30S ribosomal protein S2 [Phycisphaerae bacterium]